MKSREQTLLQHLSELRRRVFICVVAVLAGSAVSFAFFGQIVEILVEPARDLGLGTGGKLIYTEVTELLTTAIKVSFVSGLILASPVIVSQGVMFVAPGLTGREKRYLFG
ncbi:MAG: twin-arginine translocase subunit TatC, partial [Chloroflexota bacterium]|nr:twin-arginine translocase subunit TatC [Chloroflexota bacterium]